MAFNDNLELNEAGTSEVNDYGVLLLHFKNGKDWLSVMLGRFREEGYEDWALEDV